MQSTDLQLMSASAAEASQFLRNLANEKRLLTLCRLMEGECAVGQLAERVGLSPSALSQHLNRLRRDGLVDTRRDGQTIYYRLSDRRIEALIRLLYDQFCKTSC
ncbi:ArsR/SmtB family transcription factor [Ferrovibrio xuzhouensis]|uniref:ArsR/SmtB family transcription factor n=1 Tax=Ferrovibrio xuzhouensis TaxID=1576914 RepID=A0ABV7VAH8_9PROT